MQTQLPPWLKYPGIVVRDSREAPWILWHSWKEWRFGQRCPEHVWFDDYYHHYIGEERGPR